MNTFRRKTDDCTDEPPYKASAVAEDKTSDQCTQD